MGFEKIAEQFEIKVIILDDHDQFWPSPIPLAAPSRNAQGGARLDREPCTAAIAKKLVPICYGRVYSLHYQRVCRQFGPFGGYVSCSVPGTIARITSRRQQWSNSKAAELLRDCRSHRPTSRAGSCFPGSYSSS